MKVVYFVRHGQCTSNVRGEFFSPDAPLTERGEHQAQFIASRCASIPAEAIISSTYLRARQTAAPIGERLGLPVEHSDLFVERARPTQQYDVARTDPLFVSIEEETRARFGEPGWRYSDEENFEDLVARAKAALAYLESRPEKHIIVVSHGLFMRALMAFVVFGAQMSAHECWQMMVGFAHDNTGMTVLTHRTITPDDELRGTIGSHVGWRIRTWNDHAHLADDRPNA